MSLFRKIFGKNPENQKPEDSSIAPDRANHQELPAIGNEQHTGKNPDPNYQPTATTPWRTFSIFISSTFADMQAERDYLKNVIFPQVEEELQKRRIKLEIVDLRWGVDTTSMAQEDEREANVLKVCLDEIKRCRPFFIGLLGDRYGWVPPGKRMADAVLGEGLKAATEGKSVTDLEIEFGVLASKEQLTRSAFYFREPLPYDQFALKKAAMFSDQCNPELKDKVKAERKVALDRLKDRIRKHFEKEGHPEKVKTYNAAWNAEKEKVTGLETFGEMVRKDILAECENHAAETWNQVPQNWQEQELALLDAFIEGHTHVTTFITEKGEEHIPTFCGRKPLLEELKLHLLSEEAEHRGLVLTGESGSGKSAVFSMVHKMMEQEDCLILAHSAGLSPRAKHVADLLKIWNNLLRKHLGMEQVLEETEKEERLKPGLAGEQEKAPETPIEILQQQFAELLSMAAAKRRVVLLIDALDRFEPTGRAKAMTWLPSMMPLNARLLVTAITGSEKEAVKYHHGLIVRSIDVFSGDEAKEMLLVLCKKQHKTLGAAIEKIILEKQRKDGQPASSSPLWLSLAVNILMAIDQDDFEQMSKLEGRGDQQIETYLTNLAQGFDFLPGKLFLSLIARAGLLFGKEFTPAVFDYIAISRNGLREKDLESLLPAHGISWDPLRYAMLRRWFKAHLVMQGEELQWNLAHSILDNTLLDNLKETGRKEKHLAVGGYLLKLPDADVLKISETMYHLMQAGDKEMAAVYYGSFWSDAIQTDGSSRALAEAMILEDAQLKTVALHWIISLPEEVSENHDMLRAMLQNIIFSLYEHHLQNDTTVNTRIKLMAAMEGQMGELRRRAPDSADYARDLFMSYERLGDLYLQSGDPPKALEKYLALLNVAEELRRRAPDSADYARNLCIPYERLGDLYLQLGDPPKALEKYLASLDIWEELHRWDPASAIFGRGSSVSFTKLGELYLQLGYPNKALEYFLSSLNIIEQLRRRDPDSAEYARDLYISCNRLGDLYLQLGDPPKALENFLSSLNICEELHRRAPASALYARGLSISCSKLGDLYLQLGDPPKTLEKYLASHTIFEELRRRVPDSADYARDLSISYNKLGDLYLKLGDPPKALEKYLASHTIFEELHRRAPDFALYAGDLSNSYSKLGDVYLELGDPPKALEKYSASLNICKELHRRAPGSAFYARNLSVAYEKLGDLYLKLGDPPQALEKYLVSLNILEELRRRAPDSTEISRDLAVSYLKLTDFQQQFGNQEDVLHYARLLKEALLYMKKRGMFVSPPLLQVLKQLEGSGV